MSWFRSNKFSYKTPVGNFTQGPLLVGQFENVTPILNEVGASNLINLIAEAASLLRGKKNETVEVDLTGLAQAFIDTLIKVGTSNALSMFLAELLGTTTDKAAKIPMAVARSVIQDFFILNRSWLNHTQTSLEALASLKAI